MSARSPVFASAPRMLYFPFDQGRTKQKTDQSASFIVIPSVPSSTSFRKLHNFCSVISCFDKIIPELYNTCSSVYQSYVVIRGSHRIGWLIFASGLVPHMIMTTIEKQNYHVDSQLRSFHVLGCVAEPRRPANEPMKSSIRSASKTNKCICMVVH